MPKWKFIIGLGNPENKYKNTYHNIGFLFIDYLTKNAKWENPSSKNFEFAKLGDLTLVKTLVFMNTSGEAVKLATKYFSIKPEELLIVQDDSDLNIGNYKLSFNRGSAGHHGIENIIKELKTQKIWRLRIGIRPLPTEIQKTKKNPSAVVNKARAGEFVLKKISLKNLEILNQLFEEISKKLLY